MFCNTYNLIVNVYVQVHYWAHSQKTYYFANQSNMNRWSDGDSWRGLAGPNPCGALVTGAWPAHPALTSPYELIVLRTVHKKFLQKTDKKTTTAETQQISKSQLLISLLSFESLRITWIKSVHYYHNKNLLKTSNM